MIIVLVLLFTSIFSFEEMYASTHELVGMSLSLLEGALFQSYLIPGLIFLFWGFCRLL